MEDLIKDALPKEVIEVQEALPIAEPEPSLFTWGNAGLVVGVIAAAAVCAKLYKCTCKKS